MLDPEQNARLLELFSQAVDLEPAARVDFCLRECVGEPELSTELLAMLAVEHGQLGSFLATPAAMPVELDAVLGAVRGGESAAGPNCGIERPGVVLGGYVLVEELGQGGMGVVWLARQENLHREVALKLVRPNLQSAALLERFRREAKILGRLHHPGIAQVYEIGTATLAMGDLRYEQPFFAMEYVRGLPLDDHARDHDLDMRSRMQLIARVCDAVSHAHEHGVVHRDLKPGNILVAENGEPKILDFGIARVTDSDVMTMQTAVGDVIGTVPFMSPEQVIGDSSTIDARSDVYSLGAVLYQLLSGRLPADVSGRSIPEAARVIRDDEPTRLGALATTCRGDVETIVHRALEKDRERRYQSAAELAADIRRFLAHEPIVARPVSTLYQARKFARRHKGFVGGLLATFVVLVIGVVVATMLAVRANRSADALRRAVYAQGLMLASARLEDHHVAIAEQALRATPAELRGWEWEHLESRLDMSLQALSLPGDGHLVGEAWFSADERIVSAWVLHGESTAGSERRAVIERWQLSSGERLAPELSVDFVNPTEPLYFNSGWGYRANDTLHWFDSKTATELRVAVSALVHDGRPANNLTFCLAARRVAWAAPPATGKPGRSNWIQDHVTHVTDLGADAVVADRTIVGGLPFRISADGRHLAMLTDVVGGVSVWSEGRGVVRLEGHTDRVRGVCGNADWSILATASRDGTVRTWDGRTGKPIATGTAPKGSSGGVRLNAAGDRLVSSSDDGTILVWSAPELHLLTILYGHRNRAPGNLALSESGSLFASKAYVSGEYLRVWDVSIQGDPWELRGHEKYVYGLAVSPDGTIVASGGWDRTVRLWNTRTLAPIATLEGHSTWIGTIAFSPDGTRIASVDNARHLRIWDVSSGGLRLETTDYELPVAAPITWHPDGERLLVAVGDRGPALFDCRDRERHQESFGVLREFRSGVVSGDGTRFVRYFLRGRDTDERSLDCLALCATDDGRELARVAADKDSFKLAFSPAGSGPLRLLVPYEQPGEGGTRFGWCLLDAVSGEVLANPAVGQSRTLAVAFSPDGQRFVTGGYDNSIIVWDAEGKEELVRLDGHTEYVYRLVFSPDGRTLYSASGDHTVRVWGTTPLREVLQARRTSR